MRQLCGSQCEVEWLLPLLFPVIVGLVYEVILLLYYLQRPLRHCGLLSQLWTGSRLGERAFSLSVFSQQIRLLLVGQH